MSSRSETVPESKFIWPSIASSKLTFDYFIQLSKLRQHRILIITSRTPVHAIIFHQYTRWMETTIYPFTSGTLSARPTGDSQLKTEPFAGRPRRRRWPQVCCNRHAAATARAVRWSVSNRPGRWRRPSDPTVCGCEPLTFPDSFVGTLSIIRIHYFGQSVSLTQNFVLIMKHASWWLAK